MRASTFSPECEHQLLLHLFSPLLALSHTPTHTQLLKQYQNQTSFCIQTPGGVILREGQQYSAVLRRTECETVSHLSDEKLGWSGTRDKNRKMIHSGSKFLSDLKHTHFPPPLCHLPINNHFKKMIINVIKKKKKKHRV